MTPKQLDLSTLTQAEKDERLAAAVGVYGHGTRSYQRSAEKRESKRQQQDVTSRYERGELKIGECIVGPICTCRSFDRPHELRRHRELRDERDWRTESERHVSYQEDWIR